MEQRDWTQSLNLLRPKELDLRSTVAAKVSLAAQSLLDNNNKVGFLISLPTCGSITHTAKTFNYFCLHDPIFSEQAGLIPDTPGTLQHQVSKICRPSVSTKSCRLHHSLCSIRA